MRLPSGAVKRAHLTDVKGSVTLNDSWQKRRVRSCYLSDVKGTISVCTEKSGGVKVKLHTLNNMREVRASPQ
eukprot:272192-Rhodomonas_salina.1